ncbi:MULTISPECIES: AMP-binding protein [Pseudomonas]|uniref:AMP-binding protein n=1 Tax=Pseudomonas TaxID=286 RepID=UPI000569C489|nr:MULTISPECIES: AMP-binding protein [Pseudomonas]QHF28949.1 acyl-phosphate glycerol 3-phosphate acyltransferase [Pseudomonas sp. R32]UVL22157.1 AMP-binding protein [Pseudomonas donghuensis]
MSRPPPDPRAVPHYDGGAEKLLEIVQRTVVELHPQAAEGVHVTLHSVLDRDLGVDSLARVELWSRIEHEFGVRLPEHLFASADTPADVLRVLHSSHGAEAVRPLPASDASEALTATVQTPDAARTLIEVLDWHVRHQPQHLHVRLLGEGDQQEAISYGALHQGALAVAAGLQRSGLRAGQTVALMLPTGRDFLQGFLGILLAGGVPVPIYPPLRLSQIEEHLRRQAGILHNAEAKVLITVTQAKLLARLLRPQVPSLVRIASVAELTGEGGECVTPLRQPDDIAFLQYTSGSTGQPKGVMVSHANLLANLRAMGRALKVGPQDVFVSWLPMYHDMGLIGAWLGSLYYGYNLVLMSPLAFLARPERWLRAIDSLRGTLSAAPNFAYELCLNKLADSDLEGLNLSSWRLAFNGAEPVSPDTLQRFTERFVRYGLAPTALTPVYGLAEATLGVAFPPLGRGPLIDRVQREAFQTRGTALPAEADASATLRFVSSGRPLPGHQIRIVDGRGVELPERSEGHLQFTGPSTTAGYYRNPEETRRVLRDGWIDSLDFAYMAAGEVYLTGRAKDLIIRAGRNIYPYDVEAAVGNLPGLRKGCIAVFGSPDPATGTERLVVLAESYEKEAAARQRLQQEVNRIVVDLTGVSPDDIVLAPPHSVLKTSSGKIRRAASRELYERGEVGRPHLAVWRQLLRLVLQAVRGHFRRSWRSGRTALYAAYIWLLFWLVTPLTWLGVALLPRQRWCRSFTRAAARLFVWLTGVPFSVTGLEHLPESGASVLAVNHASYLDGVMLCAALPPRFSFVAKRELAGQWIAGRFLRKLGARFVERFDLQRSAADTGHLAEALEAGQPLVFFPEGTFTREPGLRTFHMGAFVLAARTGVPLLPVAIRGTRRVLRDGQWFPRYGAIHVNVCSPLLAQGPDWTAAIKLRDTTIAMLLEHLDESERAQRAG